VDAAKLKKHITLVCDRLHKGMRPKGSAGAGPPARGKGGEAGGEAGGADAAQSL